MTDLMRFAGQEGSVAGVQQVIADADTGDDLVKELEAVVERLKTIHGKEKQVLDDDTIEVARFCRSLEAILRHQQKEKLSFWGERKDYWHWMAEVAGGIKTLEQLVKKVQTISELATSQGKGRALIRMCLQERVLAECVQNSLSNGKKTRDWYFPTAVLLTPILSQRLISALYDLSDIDFALPVEGLNLDEAWPSFVQKSFAISSPSNRSKQPTPSASGSVLGTYKPFSAKEARHPSPQGLPSDYQLDQAVEEVPSQSFVKQEIPFELGRASSLLTELSTLLVEELEGYSQSFTLPDLGVLKLDDITSGLALLRDYVSARSQDASKANTKQVVSGLRAHVTELEAQLNEALTGRDILQARLEDAEVHLGSFSNQLQMAKQGKASVGSQLLQLREQLSMVKGQKKKLERQVTSLQQQKAISEDLKKAKAEQKRLEEQVESLLKETRSLSCQLTRAYEVASVTAAARDSICSQLMREAETNAVLSRSIAVLEERCHEMGQSHSKAVDSLQTEMQHLNQSRDDLLANLTKKKQSLSQQYSLEKKEWEKQLQALQQVHQKTLEESELIREELRSMHGMVEQETESLRFQLSTAKMSLEQAKRNGNERDQLVTQLKEQYRRAQAEVRRMNLEVKEKEGHVRELQEKLSISNAQCQGQKEELQAMNEQLTENTVNRDSVREEALRHQREWDDQRDRLTREVQHFGQEVDRLTEENDCLRKGLQKLLQQKVNLWQHADELEQQMVAKGNWIDSSNVDQCMGCSVLFGLFARKHHCRSCGKVFCGECSAHRARLPSNKDPVRVCRDCYGRIVDLRTPQASALVNTLANDITEPKPSEGGAGIDDSSTRVNHLPGGVALSDSSLLADLEGSDESLMQHVHDIIRHPSRRRTSPLENSSEYRIKPLSPDPLFFTMRSTRGGVNPDDPEDDFCVIDAVPKGQPLPRQPDTFPYDPKLDLRTLRKKLASLENGGSENAATENDAEKNQLDNGVKEAQDLNIEGGAIHQVPTDVHTPRTVLSWQFSSQPRGIAVGLSYRDFAGEQEAVDVLPLRRVQSHKTLLTGEYVAQNAGVYTITFSNTHSKYAGRLLSYKVWKKPPV